MNSRSNEPTTPTSPITGQPTFPIPGLPLYQPDLVSVVIYVVAALLIFGRILGDNKWAFPAISRFFAWLEERNPWAAYDRELSLLRARASLTDEFLDKAIIIADHHGRLIWANRKARSLMGNVLLQDASGDGWIPLIHQEDREEVITEWNRSLREGVDFRMRFRYQEQNKGSGNCVEAHAHIAKTPGGRVAGWVTLLWDIGVDGQCCARKLEG